MFQHNSWPVITEADKQAVMRVLDRGVLSGPLSPEVRGLEKEFANYIGAKYCLATNSGTAALHMSLFALGVGPGDEVIVPAFTFVATAMAVLQVGAKPVFVDIEPDSLGIDPTCFKKAISKKTKAVIPVHMHGMPCEIKEICEIAKSHDIFVIEDACQAHGAEFESVKVGNFGEVSAFSMQSSKGLSAGEGGLLVTDNKKLFDRAASFRNFGENINLEESNSYDPSKPLDLKRDYDSQTLGYMYRTNEISAALARSQLGRLDSYNQQAKINADILNQGLDDLVDLTPPKTFANRNAVFHKYRVRTKERDRVMDLFQKNGLEAVQWQSRTLPEQKVFRDMGYESQSFKVSKDLIDSSFCLFSHSHPIAIQSEELCQYYTKMIRNLLS